MTAAVIPLKSLSMAKSRLQGYYTPAQRVGLCLGMLHGMLGTLTGCLHVDKVFLITPDRRAARFVSRHMPAVEVLEDRQNLSLNGCADFVVEHLTRLGYGSMLFLLGDLPLLCGKDIQKAAALAREYPIVLMPDRHGSGTNAVFLTPPTAMRTHFGKGSLRKHKAEAQRTGLGCAVLWTMGFACDLDTPDDLRYIKARRAQMPGGRHGQHFQPHNGYHSN